MVINRLDIVLSANVINEIYATKSLAIATYPYAATPTLSTINGVMKKLIITFVEKATNAAIKLIKFLLSIPLYDPIYRSNYLLLKKYFILRAGINKFSFAK